VWRVSSFFSDDLLSFLNLVDDASCLDIIAANVRHAHIGEPGRCLSLFVAISAFSDVSSLCNHNADLRNGERMQEFFDPVTCLQKTQPGKTGVPRNLNGGLG
jgi:hypothetical protein